MRTVEFLDAVKARHRLATDYQLAKRLGWNQQRISGYRHRGRELDDEACIQIAEQLGVPPEYVMAAIAAERAKSAAAKRYWRKAANLLKEGTGALLLAAILGAAQFAAAPAEAGANRAYDELYIMRSRRSRRRWPSWHTPPGAFCAPARIAGALVHLGAGRGHARRRPSQNRARRPAPFDAA